MDKQKTLPNTIGSPVLKSKSKSNSPSSSSSDGAESFKNERAVIVLQNTPPEDKRVRDAEKYAKRKAQETMTAFKQGAQEAKKTRKLALQREKEAKKTRKLALQQEEKLQREIDKAKRERHRVWEKCERKRGKKLEADSEKNRKELLNTLEMYKTEAKFRESGDLTEINRLITRVKELKCFSYFRFFKGMLFAADCGAGLIRGFLRNLTARQQEQCCGNPMGENIFLCAARYPDSSRLVILLQCVRSNIAYPCCYQGRTVDGLTIIDLLLSPDCYRGSERYELLVQLQLVLGNNGMYHLANKLSRVGKAMDIAKARQNETEIDKQIWTLLESTATSSSVATSSSGECRLNTHPAEASMSTNTITQESSKSVIEIRWIHQRLWKCRRALRAKMLVTKLMKHHNLR